MRIVAGQYRGRRIEAPKGEGTRPTTDRVREALFSRLVSLTAPDLGGGSALDAFAGSGALGFEALSRGIGRVTFVERDRAALATLKANAAAPTIGPRNVPLPPRMLMSTGRAENDQCAMSGVAIRLKIAKSTPASPQIAPERTNACSRTRATLPPTNGTRSRFSRVARRRRPKGDATTRRRTSATTARAARAAMRIRMVIAPVGRVRMARLRISPS